VEWEPNGARAYALELWAESRERVADELCERASYLARLGMAAEAATDRFVSRRLRARARTDRAKAMNCGGAHPAKVSRGAVCDTICFESRGKPAMTDYRFEIGERVTYSEKRFPSGVWAAELIVVEQLTPDKGPQYRLRVEGGAIEYVLAEHELFPSVDHHQNRRSNPSPWAA
jgi:hypothetical protein